MEFTTEKIFYQDSDVQVTSSRLVVYGKTYAMRNISSVVRHRIEPSRTWAILFMVFGVLITLIALANGSVGGGLFFGVVLLVIGLSIYLSQHDSYAVRISSNSGEANAIFSKSSEYIHKIVDAINDAIIERG